MTFYKNKSKGLASKHSNKQKQKEKMKKKDNQPKTGKVGNHLYPLKRGSLNDEETISIKEMCRITALPKAQSAITDLNYQVCLAFVPGGGFLAHMYELTHNNGNLAADTVSYDKHNANVNFTNFGLRARILNPRLHIKYTGTTLANQGSLYVYLGPSVGNPVMSTLIGNLTTSRYTTPYSMSELRAGIHIHIGEHNANSCREYMEGVSLNDPIDPYSIGTPGQGNIQEAFNTCWIFTQGCDTTASFIISSRLEREIIPDNGNIALATSTPNKITHSLMSKVYEGASDTLDHYAYAIAKTGSQVALSKATEMLFSAAPAALALL